MKLLPNKLNEKDRRAIKIGIVAMAMVVLFSISSNWLEKWFQVRRSISDRQLALKKLVSSQIKHAGLLTVVPVFEMPQDEEKQKFLFRNKLKEQLKKAGIKSKPLEILTKKTSSQYTRHYLLRVKCSCDKCTFNQILDFLAALKENPYLASIEELDISCDPQKRQEFEFDIVVSTFVK